MRAARARLRLIELERSESVARDSARMRGSLAEFTRAAWPLIEPVTPLVWGWHLDAICTHLEALYRGDLDGDLIINVPPGSSKSTLCAVMLPAWAWLNNASWRSIFASYAQDLSIRDSLRCRAIVESDWYRSTFAPAWEMSGDQNVKGRFENTARGFRMATSVGGGALGHRAGAVVVDDPHNVKEALALSDSGRRAVRDWWDQGFANRLNDLRTPRRLVVMQRLAEDDLSGHLLSRAAQGKGRVVHLCLPSEFDPSRRCRTFDRDGNLLFEDPRTEPGELLDPVRFPKEVLDEERDRLGPSGYAGQHDQRPVPAGGELFSGAFPSVAARPIHIQSRIRYWDKAGTQGGGARTAGCLMSRARDGRFYVEDMVTGQWALPDREQRIRDVADSDPPGTEIWIEQEPGSGGKDSALISVQNLAGHRVKLERPTGDKVHRAGPLADQAKVGNVVVVADGSWDVEGFRRECSVFPRGKLKDQVDAASGAFNKLALKRQPGRAVVGPELEALRGYPYDL